MAPGRADLEWVGRLYFSPEGLVPTSGNHPLNWPHFWQSELRGWGRDGECRILSHLTGGSLDGGQWSAGAGGAWRARGHLFSIGPGSASEDTLPALVTPSQGTPRQQRMDEGKYFFSSSNFLPWHWLGPPLLPLPTPHSGSCQEGKSYVHTWVEQTKTARLSLDGAHILRLTRAAAPHSSLGWTRDCLGEPPPLHCTTPTSCYLPSTTTYPTNREGFQMGGGFLKINLNPTWWRGKRSFLSIGLRLAPRILIFP